MPFHAVICVKQVPDTTQVQIDPRTGSLVRKGIPAVINPFDLYALEAALKLRDQSGGAITALSMGPPPAEEALRQVLGYGADRAVLLTDRAFAGADTLATTRALAAGIGRIAAAEPVDLVICGRQSIDGDTGQVGPGLARRLGFSQFTYIASLEQIDLDAGTIRGWRQREDGRELVEGRLPAVMTVTESFTPLRYVSLPDLLAAAGKEIGILSAADLGLAPAELGLKGSPTRVKKIFAPPARARGELFTAGAGAAAAAEWLLERLASRGLAFGGEDG